MNRPRLRPIFIAAVSLIALAGSAPASTSMAASASTIKVVFQAGSDVRTAHFTDWKAQFEAKYPDVTVELLPIEGNDSDYYTRLALLNSSPSTAPDVMYQDSSYLAVDAAAGRFAPLDDYVSTWDRWSQFPENVQDYSRGFDGNVYGLFLGTDVQVVWYNKDILAQAGIPLPWEPKTWADLLETAKTIKANVPSVTPINIYSGKAALDAASVRGQELLTSGTNDGYVFNDETQKWVIGSQGFVDALQLLADIYQGGLGLPPEVTSDPNYTSLISDSLLPQGEVAIAIDGSWLPAIWGSTGSGSWPEWANVMDFAAVPTQFGEAPGTTSMSGGWMLAMGATSPAKDAAWDFMSLALDKDNQVKFDVEAGQIAVQGDVAVDPAYAEDPLRKALAEIVPSTTFIPNADKTREVQLAMNDAQQSVMTGEKSPEEAAAIYDQAVIAIVGEENTETPE